MIWVINCNTTICRIYEYNKPGKLSLLKELNHPENKLKTSELTSDKPGRYQSSTSARGSYNQDTDPKQIKINDFLREVAKELDQGRNTQAYEKLILIAAPQTTGILNQHLNKHVNQRITNHIQKDLINLPEHELLTFIKNNTVYPDI